VVQGHAVTRPAGREPQRRNGAKLERDRMNCKGAETDGSTTKNTKD
jgi:hypothetical protein